MQKTNKIAFTTRNNAAAATVATRLGGQAYLDNRDNSDHLPFSALVTVATDHLSEITQELAPEGIYVICERVIKPGEAGCYGLFPMMRHPDLTHEQSDAHWRDVHAPLALEHHIHMTHYLQICVMTTLHGPELDGIALCGFATEDDVRNRFYTTEEGVKIIAADIAKFANLKTSPRRLMAVPA